MTIEQKTVFFQTLVRCGFKEIEVGYPSASDTDFNFIRLLITKNMVPDDVWIQVMQIIPCWRISKPHWGNIVFIQVLTPAREDLIRRTVESLAGTKKAILHMYTATCPRFRQVVFKNSQEETVKLAVKNTKFIRQLTDECTAKFGTLFRYEYSPETFSQTEPDFAIQVCEAVKAAWGRAGPAHDDRIIFNLPATVEIGPPNHYADLVCP